MDDQVRAAPIAAGLEESGLAGFSAGVPLADASKVVLTGGAPALTALAGGHVDFAGQQWSESAGLVLGGKIRGLAVVNPVRLPGLPDIPTA